MGSLNKMANETKELIEAMKEYRDDCIGWHKLTEENYRKSLTHYNKHTPAIDGVGE